MRLIGYLTVTALAFVAIRFLAGIYDLGLRNPQFFDGWILFTGMACQMLFHFRENISALRRYSDTTWTQLHILVGYVVIGSFAVHTNVALPNSALEWALWAIFVLVVVSGLVGSYLMVAIPIRLEQHAAPVEYQDIAKVRSDIAVRAEALALSLEDDQGLRTIWQLYTTTLRNFFNGPRNLVAHLNGSRLPLKRLCHEIEVTEMTIDNMDKKALMTLKDLVVEKDQLDFQYANQWLLGMWTFIHVPATYGLVVLTIVHIVVVYAFSSGAP